MTATEARVHFGEALRLVQEQGEAVVIERAGRPAAVLISMEDYLGRTGWKLGDVMARLAPVHAAYREALARGAADEDLSLSIRVGRDELDPSVEDALL